MLFCLSLVALLVGAEPAFAGKDDAAAGILAFPSLVALLSYPAGLALHALILAYAPRRGLGLVSNLENHRAKTLILGSLNTFFLLFLAITLHKKAPPVAVLAILLWVTLAAVGSHGIARGLGARLLGGQQTTPPGDLKEVALGWFVFLFAIAIPGLGALLGIYWCVRATGGVVLTLFSVPPSVETTSADDDPPGDLKDLLD